VILNELAADLAAASLGTVGTNIFVSHFPLDPSNILSLHDQIPVKPIRTMAKRRDHEVHMVQLIGRDTGHDACEAKVRAVYTRWDMFSGTLSSVRYVIILAAGSPVYLGVDENKRFRWSCMFEVRRAES